MPAIVPAQQTQTENGELTTDNWPFVIRLCAVGAFAPLDSGVTCLSSAPGTLFLTRPSPGSGLLNSDHATHCCTCIFLPPPPITYVT
jgi:hypothetical protein